MRKANIEIVKKEVVEIDAFKLHSSLRDLIYEEINLNPNATYDFIKKTIEYAVSWDINVIEEPSKTQIDMVNAFNVILDYLKRRHGID